jgi:hypothetical protein
MEDPLDRHQDINAPEIGVYYYRKIEEKDNIEIRRRNIIKEKD